MKNFTSGKTVLCALGFCALFGASAARAQNYSFQVDVPFQFVAGEKVHPAGDYRFTVDAAIHTLKIESRTKMDISMVPLTPGTDRRSGSVLALGMVRFTKAGNVHVLNGIWRPGAADGSVTYTSRSAKEALRAGSLATDITSGNNPDLP